MGTDPRPRRHRGPARHARRHVAAVLGLEDPRRAGARLASRLPNPGGPAATGRAAPSAAPKLGLPAPAAGQLPDPLVCLPSRLGRRQRPTLRADHPRLARPRPCRHWGTLRRRRRRLAHCRARCPPPAAPRRTAVSTYHYHPRRARPGSPAPPAARPSPTRSAQPRPRLRHIAPPE